jgi:hypothetical protein
VTRPIELNVNDVLTAFFAVVLIVASLARRIRRRRLSDQPAAKEDAR